MVTKILNYFPVATNDLKVNTILDFDIFIQTSNNIVLFRKQNLPFTESTLHNLAENRVRTIFISEEDREKVENYHQTFQNYYSTDISSEGFTAPFDKPENVENYYKTYSNYYPLEKVNLLPGSEIDFNIYKQSDIDVEHYIGPGRKNSLSDIVPEDIHESNHPIVIHNDDIPLYREYIKKITSEHLHLSKDIPEFQYNIIRENSKFVIRDILKDPKNLGNIHQAKELVETLFNAIMDNKNHFNRLLKITTHDYYTYTHSLNVCSLSIGLGSSINLKDSELLELGLGALLHDIGKCSVNPRILNKPGVLTEEEYKEIQCHVIASKDLLEKSGHQISENSLNTILQHHEKMSGSGYPYNLAGDQIHLFGRIGAIVDFYDALTTKRPYKKIYTPFEAFQLLNEVKEDYDQSLIKRFIVMLGNQVKA